MKHFLIVLLFISNIAFGQKFNISGNLKDEAGMAVVGANIALVKAKDSSILKYYLSDSLGFLKVKGVDTGKYFITITGLYLVDFHSNSFHLLANCDLGTLILKKKPTKLKEVNIIAKKPLVELLADKIVFNVQGSLVSTGVSAFEVLRKAPGVIIDNQDNLILEGKSGVSIYIDGKISALSGSDLTNYLKSFQATDIDAIEIITQPSSKYDAAGNAGVINIKLKKNKNYGTNGTVSAGYTIGRFSKYNSSISLNYRSKRVNFFNTYSSSIGKNYYYLNLDRFQSSTEFNQHSFTISNDQNQSLRTGIDYTINKNSTIGILFNGNFSNSNNVGTSRTPISNTTTNEISQVLRANGFTSSDNNNVTTNLNYRFADPDHHEFNIDADYGHYRSVRNNLQPNNYYDKDEINIINQYEYRMITPIQINVVSLKADYSQNFLKATISGGLKFSIVSTGNVFDFYDVVDHKDKINNNRSNTFNYTEHINAGYININRMWKKVGIQAGLRGEQTVSDGELQSIQVNMQSSIKRNYLDLFPSACITYAVNQNNSLALTYSRRIERPSYSSLNPFEYNSDELSFGKGNPFLKPQYTNTIKLAHTFKYTLNTSLSYSFIRDFFAQITDTLNGNRNFISPQNIANQKIINFGVSYPFSLFKWWSIYANVNIYQSIYTAKNPKFVAINQTTASFYGQNTISLPKAYKLEISGWFSSPSIWSGTYRTRSIGSLDVAVQKQLIPNKFSLRVALSDIMHTANWQGNTQYGALFIKGGGGYESRRLSASLNYNFGRREIKSALRRSSAIEDESSRTR